MKNDAKREYETWLNNVSEPKILEDLKQMDEIEVEVAFSNNIAFGTAGLRGILGLGTSRLNVLTVRRVTLGLVNYLKKKNQKDISLAIGYDPRYMHKEFYEEILKICSNNSIQVYIYDDIKPTPLLSYLVRKKECQAGIMLTASHNPKEYNGYKVYDATGAQLNLDDAKNVMDEIGKINDYLETKYTNINYDFVEFIDEDIDEDYFKEIKGIVKDDIKKDLKIVFTPEHGTAYKILPKALRYFGFENIIEVEEQMVPDPEFSKTDSPNPELNEAFTLALEYAQKNNADIIVATDPDADRLGVGYKTEDNNYNFLTGNELGSLLIEYLLNRDDLKSGIIYNTVVTGEMGARIARKKGLNVKSTLPGFKFIGEQIEKNKEDKFIFGYEESYGYLINSAVRDKDAIQATLLTCEMFQVYKNNNVKFETLLDSLNSRLGFREEVTHALIFAGLEGQQKIKKIMNYVHTNELLAVGNLQISKTEDFEKNQQDLPKADILKYYLENDMGWFVLRPSGTEPKLKIYTSIGGNSREDAIKKEEEIYADILNLTNEIIDG